MRVFFIDNLDSSAYNIVEEFEKKDCEVVVYRSEAGIKVIESEIKKFKPKLIVIGPGASLKNASDSIQAIELYYKEIPILGIGLGNSCIIEAFGGKVGKAPEISFGKQFKITHDGKTIYKKLDKAFNAAIYHPLACIEMPYCLEVSSRTDTDLITGVRHKEKFIEGIQFNPGSILTPLGSLIIENLIEEVSKR